MQRTALWAETANQKAKDVKGIMEEIVPVAADQLKKGGSFKIAGALDMKLEKKLATPAGKVVNPFANDPCIFKAMPDYKITKALPMKKLKEMFS